LKVFPAKLIKPRYSKCYKTDVPTSHRLNGISGFDTVFYITAEHADTSTLAWAAFCDVDEITGSKSIFLY
jgi:hypothetical protein